MKNSYQVGRIIPALLLASAMVIGRGVPSVYADKQSKGENDGDRGEGRGPSVSSLNLVPVTSVRYDNGQLLASGIVRAVVNGRTRYAEFTDLPITLSARPAMAFGPLQATSCPILNLALPPIGLNLLGLNVNTSPICLDITAFQGGGLLGDLLCSVANLLSTGTPGTNALSTALATLSPTDLNNLLLGLGAIVNGALGAVLNNATIAAITPAQQPASACDIINLNVGPLNLNLLGLQVNLDNCAGGTVAVDVYGVRGGGLLGNLLCGLTQSGGLGIGGLLQQLVNILTGLGL